MQDGGVIGSAPAVAPSAAPSRRVELEEWDYRANASPVNGFSVGDGNGQYSMQTAGWPGTIVHECDTTGRWPVAE